MRLAPARAKRGWGREHTVGAAARALSAALLALLLAACSAAPPERFVPVVVERAPHDSDAFTQGLLLADGYFYESTGRYGRSELREVIPESGAVLRSRPLADRYFGEGLALVEDELIQLTWQRGEAFRYDRETFERVATHRYDTEGWGLCFDGEALWMSDGSARLFRRDPTTFELRETVEVTLGGEPLERLNELECVAGSVWANVWLTDTIVRIDPERGRVTATVDAADLLSPAERAALSENAVLNGIAWDPERELFWLTGKLWPALFAVRFEPAP